MAGENKAADSADLERGGGGGGGDEEGQQQLQQQQQQQRGGERTSSSCVPHEGTEEEKKETEEATEKVATVVAEESSPPNGNGSALLRPQDKGASSVNANAVCSRRRTAGAKMFSNLKKRPPVNIGFEDVSLTVRTGGIMARLRKGGGRKQILKGVTGEFRYYDTQSLIGNCRFEKYLFFFLDLASLLPSWAPPAPARAPL